MNTISKFKSIFSNIEDPRSHINKLHELDDILLIGIISVICAADTWKNMEAYAKAIHPLTSDARRQELDSQLREYCELDTWAMVKIWEELRKKA